MTRKTRLRLRVLHHLRPSDVAQERGSPGVIAPVVSAFVLPDAKASGAIRPGEIGVPDSQQTRFLLNFFSFNSLHLRKRRSLSRPSRTRSFVIMGMSVSRATIQA